ncbi:hypothetical protein M9Y10_003205 [Tritrichomonas musculus]|uniref:Calponin-homology (CH) domain-containing protein n=1 Tax=Tritrichomonas musculus TaxID=1915356 RepID=A0ABR2JNU8_9EUKA
MNTEHRNTECIPQQIKVFSKWVKCALSNNRLDVTVKDITKDLKDGVILVELSEVLVCKLAPRDWELQPKRTEDMVHNSELAIEMFTKDGPPQRSHGQRSRREQRKVHSWPPLDDHSPLLDRQIGSLQQRLQQSRRQLQILIEVESFALRRPEALQAGADAVGARPRRELPRHRRIPAAEPGAVRTPRLLLPREGQLLHARSERRRNGRQSCIAGDERTQHPASA